MPTPNRVKFIVKSVTATYTAQPIDWVLLCDPTSASFTVTLPSPTSPNVYGLLGGQSRPFLIKHSSGSTNTVTVTPPSGTIDGAASIVLNSRQGVEVVSDGTNFHVVKSINITSAAVTEQITALTDANGNAWLKAGSTTSAVNQVTVTDAATGNPPQVSATGSDTNISLELVSKGTGIVAIQQPGGVTGTSAAGAITLNGQQGVITTESLSTAAGSTYTLTMTNSSITATSNVLVEVGYGSCSAGIPILTKVAASAGSVVISILNLSATAPSGAAFNGSLKVQFLVL